MAHVLQTTQSLVILHRCLAENGKKMYLYLQRTCTNHSVARCCHCSLLDLSNNMLLVHTSPQYNEHCLWICINCLFIALQPNHDIIILQLKLYTISLQIEISLDSLHAPSSYNRPWRRFVFFCTEEVNWSLKVLEKPDWTTILWTDKIILLQRERRRFLVTM